MAPVDPAARPLLDTAGEKGQGQRPPDDQGKAGVSFWGSVFNLANAAMGAGVLAFPFAFAKSGVVAGPLLGVLLGGLMCFTLHVVGLASDAAFAKAPMKNGSYQEVVGRVLGPRAELSLNCLMIVYLTLCNVAFFRIMFDQIEPIVHELASGSTPNSPFVSAKWSPFVLMPIFAFGICFPLCLIKDMGTFAIPSTLSQLGVMYAVGVVVYHAAARHPESREIQGYGNIEMFKWDFEMLAAVPLIMFSFQCHLTFPLVYSSLGNKSLRRMDAVNLVCILFCLALYVLIGVPGYYMLGNAAPGDILFGVCASGDYYNQCGDEKNCQWSNETSSCSCETVSPVGGCCMPVDQDSAKCTSTVQSDILIARACIAIKVACSYAMLTFVCRTCIQDLILPRGAVFSDRAYLMHTVISVTVTMGVAMICPGISIAMGFAGVLVVIMDLVFPGWMLVVLDVSPMHRKIGQALIGFGVALCFLCIWIEVKQLL